MSAKRTVGELFAKVENLLCECESASFDATCILEDIGKIGRGNLRTKWNDRLSENDEKAVLNAAQKRSEGYPLQYLLGTWDFLTLTLAVGDGVLIPRPETELLCEAVAQKIQEKTCLQPVSVWDLCAGSGCVGLGIASLLPKIQIALTEVEFSEKAALYLTKNIQRYAPKMARIVMANVLEDSDCFKESIDVLVSNPPYIPTGDLADLQREVQYEPTMALDGAIDGLAFYRAIAEKWFPKVLSGGIVAVEIGIGQSAAVTEIFSSFGLSQIQVLPDLAGIDRVIIGVMP